MLRGIMFFFPLFIFSAVYYYINIEVVSSLSYEFSIFICCNQMFFLLNAILVEGNEKWWKRS